LASTIEKIKQLREETAAGMMDVKRALEESEGDVEGARKVLRERGQALAAKKSGRAATEGLIEAYVHFNGRVGVLVEVNCETDFAEMGKPENISQQIIEGRMRKWVAEQALLTQSYVKEPEKTVGDLLQETIQKVGENIVIRRFVHYEL
jgi:elongation factor Ts